jgi:hypothetical protein
VAVETLQRIEDLLQTVVEIQHRQLAIPQMQANLDFELVILRIGDFCFSELVCDSGVDRASPVLAVAVSARILVAKC